jgi:hypothetical protein
MNANHGRFLFVVCLVLALAAPGYSDPAAPEGVPEREKQKLPDILPTAPARAAEKARSRNKGPDRKIVVCHHDTQQSGWNVTDTANFRIYHLLTREQAEKAAVAAEQARATVHKRWFGGNYADWGCRCEIAVHPDAEDYSRATGVPGFSPGHSTVRMDGCRVISRRIELHADDPHMIDAILPHEVTHVVLAGQFGDRPLPRWADEGMAVSDEPRSRIQRHLRDLPRHRANGLLFNTRELIRMRDYPSPERIGAFYAESVSIVEFLVAEKGAQTMTRFVRDGQREGYEAALKNVYGWTFDDLERHWQKYAFNQ